MIKKTFFFVTAAMLLILAQRIYAQEQVILMEGLDGKQHSLKEYAGKGQWVVVNVWATACPYCRR